MSDLPQKPSITVAIFAGLACIVLWLANLWILSSFSSQDRGTAGDMFGAVNSIFTGMAFVGVVYATLLQRHEVDIAREEISRTKEILDKQQDQLELQNKETRRQSFENTFFQLLRLLTDLTESIDLRHQGSVTKKGKDTFVVFTRRIKKYFIDGRDAQHPPIENYERFYESHNRELGHYFRTFYNIIKYVDNSEIDNKKFYTNIVRAQLSDSEVAIMFYNGLSKHGTTKLKPLIEKYSLLKNLNDADVFSSDLKGKYASSAFGKKLS